MISWRKMTRRGGGRRLEPRRSRPAEPSRFARAIRQPGAIEALLIAALFVLAACALDAWPPHPLPYRLGQFIPADINARVPFRVLQEEKLDQAIEDARSRAPATFRLDEALFEDILTSLKKMPTQLADAKELAKVPPALAAPLGLTPPTQRLAEAAEKRKQAEAAEKAGKANEAKTLRLEANRIQTQADGILKAQQAVYDAWVKLASDDERGGYDGDLKQLRKALLLCYVVRPDYYADQVGRKAVLARIVVGDSISLSDVGDLIGQQQAEKMADRLRRAFRQFPPTMRDSMGEYILGRLRTKPLYVYDAPQSDADAQAAGTALAANPPETVYKHYGVGQLLIQRTTPPEPDGPQASLGLTATQFDLLREEHRAYLAAQTRADRWGWRAQSIARAGVIVLLSLLLVSYIVVYQHHVIEGPGAARLAGLLILCLAMAKALWLLEPVNLHAAVLPVCFGGIVLAIAYDRRFALAVGAILAGLVVFQLRADVNLLIVLLAAMTVCVFQLREVRTRSKIMLVCLAGAASAALVVWALALQECELWPFALRDSLWAVGGVLLAGLIVQALLPAVERIFHVVTGSTLLEWCDASKPLLKRLAMDVPGTYNHSLQLGVMCEAAAEAIGARGLLARVGAYYHDIGKIHKPDYFTENQSDGQNRHDKLSPAMSLLIIVGHVKDGLEMARRYNLPPVLREFIASHHGTTLVKFFYHSASEASKNGNGPKPDENQFRYPGPKPRSKEAAILMLADGSESSVRAMGETTPTRIRTQVHKIVTDRLEDGQLDECLLTLREVHAIEDSFVKSLCGMYHGRIAYPSDEKDKTDEKPKADKDATPEEPAPTATPAN